MAGLFFDEDLRRIYEVPTNPTLTIDENGYRVYGDAGGSEASSRLTGTELWSAMVDFRNLNQWSTVALSRQGGAQRFLDEAGDPVFQSFDLRLINSWEMVIADYPHEWNIDANLFGDAATGALFDTTRISSPGVIPRINRADSLQTIQRECPVCAAGEIEVAPIVVDSIGGGGINVDLPGGLFAVSLPDGLDIEIETETVELELPEAPQWEIACSC